MSDTNKFNSVVSFLWSIADLLNGALTKSEFQKIILPFSVLRRFDYALEATKAMVWSPANLQIVETIERPHFGQDAPGIMLVPKIKP